MNDEQFKHAYAFTLLGVTIAWAVFCVWIVYRAVSSGIAADILVAAGASGLLGMLTTIDTIIAQHYFRKAKTQEGEAKPQGQGEGQ